MHLHFVFYSDDLPTDMFITYLIQPDLDVTRVLLFESLKTHDDFPFDLECDLKRRVFTRRGEPVKLSHDIHTLVSVMEGEDFSVIKELISSSKRRTVSQSINAPPSNGRHDNAQNNCQCRNDMTVLRDTLTSVQSEMLLLKQSVNAANQIRSGQFKVLTDTVKDIKCDVQMYANQVVNMPGELKQLTLSHSRLFLLFYSCYQ